MGEREDNVYKAKLAEQAERYDGKKLSYFFRQPHIFLVYFVLAYGLKRKFKYLIRYFMIHRGLGERKIGIYF